MGSPLEMEPELGKKWSWGGKGRGQKGRGGALRSHCGSGSVSGLPKGALVMAGCVSVLVSGRVKRWETEGWVRGLRGARGGETTVNLRLC